MNGWTQALTLRGLGALPELGQRVLAGLLCGPRLITRFHVLVRGHLRVAKGFVHLGTA